MEYKEDRDRDRAVKTADKDIPNKLRLWDAWCQHGKDVILQGTDKYSGAAKDKFETIEIMPMVVGKKGYIDFIICDIIKRLIRFRNDGRQRDLVKINVWCYLLDKFLKESEGE